MAILGGILGALAALAIHKLAENLRRSLPTPTATIGWVITVIAVACCGLLAHEFFVTRGNKGADLGPLWGIVALLLLGLLLVCAVLGYLHCHYYKLGWVKTFGIIMAEAGTATAVGFAFNAFLYPIANLIRGGNNNIDNIFASYGLVRTMLGYFDMILLISLLVLAAFGGRPKKMETPG